MTPEFEYAGRELPLFEQARNWKRYYARRLRPFVRGHVLEVGAGLGVTTAALARAPHESWTCLEPDASLAGDLRERIGSVAGSGPWTVHVCRIADLPGGSRFDTIIYVDVLEHVEDDRAELAEAADRLEPGGAIVVLGPAHAWLMSPFDRTIGHHRRYDAESLRAAAPPGLDVEHVFFLDAVGVLASLGNRLLLRQRMPTLRQIRFWDRFMVPLSRLLDPLLGHRIGKSIVGVLRRRDDRRRTGEEEGP